MKLEDAQNELYVWALRCFGRSIVADKIERAKRVVEESLELGQASGLSADDCRDLVAYVFSRKMGVPSQEIAGVLVTTLVLAHTHDVSAAVALQTEIDRINTPEIFQKIRGKQVSKEVAGVGTAKDIAK